MLIHEFPISFYCCFKLEIFSMAPFYKLFKLPATFINFEIFQLLEEASKMIFCYQAFERSFDALCFALDLCLYSSQFYSNTNFIITLKHMCQMYAPCLSFICVKVPEAQKFRFISSVLKSALIG
jgi:hypothetical protein